MSQDDFFTTLGVNDPSQPQLETRRGRRALGEDAAETRTAGRRRRAEERAAKKKRQRRRRIVSVTLIFALVAALGFGSFQAFQIIRDARSSATSVQDYEGAGQGEVVVTIPEGATGQEIGEILQEADVVATVSAFLEAFSRNANAVNIQAGTYTLRQQMSAANAVAALLDPASRSDHTLTIPEGFTKTQVRDRLVAVGGYTEEEVDAAFADTEAIGLPAAAHGEIEGWLAPSTYDVPEGANVVDVVASMVALTLQRLQEAGVSEADYETVLIKASIIEREVATEQYNAQVARVIENRIADTGGETRGMLQMDSTVLYGLDRTGGIPTTAEVADASNPYNTYQHAGLPPTPISNPGAATIAAAQNPDEGSWLYFVTVNLETGETLFASSLSEQQANTERLTEYCQQNPTVCSSGN